MLDSTTNDDHAGVDERYTTAINARTLEVSNHHGGPVDILAAAAWSQSRVGSLLLRLHAEYDGAGHTRSHTDAALLRQRLKSLGPAQVQVAMWATKRGMESPLVKSRHAILWWLDRVCKSCHGRRWRTVAGTPHLSGDKCPACQGLGETVIPHGQDGRALLGYIEDCLSLARDSIKRRLRGK